MEMNTILGIDDEQVVLDSIVKLCSMEGWNVDTALDASIGIKKLEKQSYKLIICDIMMPNMDGFQFLKKLRSLEIETPVIITTGYSTIEIAIKSLYEGGIDFLPKPFSYEELISSIKRGLEYSRIHSQILQSTISLNSHNTSILYIPCPHKYLRFGYGTWAYTQEDGLIKMGITDLFLKTVGNIEKLNLVSAGDEVFQGVPCAWITSSDQLNHKILAPYSGRVLKKNDILEKDLTIIEKDPYFDGWTYILIPSNLDSESGYLQPCNSEHY